MCALSETPKSRRVAFTFDERSLESLETLKARGVIFDEITVTAPDGTAKTLYVPRLAPVREEG